MSYFFSKSQVALLNYLNQQKKSITLTECAKALEMDQIFLSGDSQFLKEKNILSIEETDYLELALDEEGLFFYQHGFPERTIASFLLKHPNTGFSIPDLTEKIDLSSKEIGKTLKYLTDRKWATNQNGVLQLGTISPTDLEATLPEEALVQYLGKHQEGVSDRVYIQTDLMEKDGLHWNQALTNLKGRKKIVVEKARKHRHLQLTPHGKQILQEGIEYKEEITNLTHEHLIDGSWKQVVFKPYNIKEITEPVFTGKIHPFIRILNETRRVFFDMGFSEINSPYVETTFWNFDALFQPQDHPAREMQDTFYLKQPKTGDLPEDSKMVDRVRAVHENGGDTGSIGWLYKWNPKIAQQMLLRTHNTGSSIRQIARHPKGPQKIFSLGRVFRRETIDYKHLPEFVQVDGIIIDEKSSFSHLIGTLKEFYRKMGFDKVDFRPGYFPYTEPSMEVFVYLESKKDWVEMGGSGMFRPEVTHPFGCTEPVLAWGLGLERLAMFRYQLSDIRDIYMSDIKWLKEEPLCQ